MAPYSRTIPCHDTLGRSRTTNVGVDQDRRRVTVMTPQPAASYDWHELDELIAALNEARAFITGRR